MSNPPQSPGAEEEPGGFLVTLAHRPRLLAGALIMVATYLVSLFAPVVIRESTRLLIAWNVGAWAYLVLIMLIMPRPTADPRVEARPEDESQWVLVVLGVVAACASLAAIVWELGPVKTMEVPPRPRTSRWSAPAFSAPGPSSRSCSRSITRASISARSPTAPRAGSSFPAKPEPGWTEFVYQAFTVGCTFASSDTNVTSTRMRRICVIQGVVGFFFNTIVLALAINIAAGFF